MLCQLSFNSQSQFLPNRFGTSSNNDKVSSYLVSVLDCYTCSIHYWYRLTRIGVQLDSSVWQLCCRPTIFVGACLLTLAIIKLQYQFPSTIPFHLSQCLQCTRLRSRVNRVQGEVVTCIFFGTSLEKMYEYLLWRLSVSTLSGWLVSTRSQLMWCPLLLQVLLLMVWSDTTKIFKTIGVLPTCGRCHSIYRLCGRNSGWSILPFALVTIPWAISTGLLSVSGFSPNNFCWILLSFSPMILHSYKTQPRQVIRQIKLPSRLASYNGC